MRHLAARHDITYLSFEDPTQTEADRAACARSARRSRPFRGPTRPRAPGASTPSRRVTSSTRCRTPSRSTGPPPTARAVEQLLATGTLRRRRLRLPLPVVNLPERLPCPGDPVHPQRRGGNLAPARGAGRQSGLAVPAAQQWQRMLRFEADGARAGSIWCSRCPRRTADVRAALSRQPARAGPRRPDRRRHRLLHAGPSRSPGARTHGLHRLDGLAAERRRHDLLLPRDPAADPPGRARAPRSASSAARRRRRSSSSPRSRASRSPAAWTMCGRTSPRGAVYVVPLRIGGGTRLKIFEAMAMAKAVVSTTVGAEGLPVTSGQRHRHRRRAGALRARRRAPDARQPRRAGASRRRRARWSSSATTGRRSRQDFEDALTPPYRDRRTRR